MRKHTKNRLLLKTYVYFALMVLLVSTMIAVIFLSMYQHTTRTRYREQLGRQAETVSARFQEFISNDDYGSCLSYLEILSEIDKYEIWSIANPYVKNPMPRIMTTMEFADIEQENYRNIIYSAFLGTERFLTSYSEMHGCTMMAAGVPIYRKNGEVCGALLINTSMGTQDEVIRNSVYMILFSAFVALVVSFFIAFVFAKQLSKPVLEMRDTALKLAEGDYTGKTGIHRNDEIGELADTMDFLADKLSENEKIRSNLEQMRLDFFANVSHELRTPITVLRAYTETLIDGVVTEKEKVHQYYERMLSECKSMQRLVGDLLLLSKMQNPDFKVEKEPVDLMRILDEIIRSAGTIAGQKGIRTEVHSEKDMLPIQGDYERLRQMFLVIFDNAVKFSPENSTIHVSVTCPQTDLAKISIRDEGVGISPEELPSIFEKFYKSKLRQNAKGTGLGLAIAKQIALKHNGEIHVESEVGKGSEFTFLLPLIPDKELRELID